MNTLVNNSENLMSYKLQTWRLFAFQLRCRQRIGLLCRNLTPENPTEHEFQRVHFIDDDSRNIICLSGLDKLTRLGLYGNLLNVATSHTSLQFQQYILVYSLSKDNSKHIYFKDRSMSIAFLCL